MPRIEFGGQTLWLGTLGAGRLMFELFVNFNVIWVDYSMRRLDEPTTTAATSAAAGVERNITNVQFGSRLLQPAELVVLEIRQAVTQPTR